MEKNDNFNRTYPVLGFVLLLIITIAPALVAVALGFIALPGIQSSQNILMTMAYSALLALLCSLASLVLGLPGAHMLATYRFPLKGLFRWLYALVLFLPSTVLALCPQVLFGKSGLLPMVDIPYPWLRTAIVLTVFNTPVVMILVSIWWSRIDNSLEKTASTLGIGRSSAFRRLTLPRLRPAILASASIVFLRCLSSMAVVMTTAGGTRFMNSSSLIFGYAATGGSRSAAVLSLLTLLLSIVVAFPFIATIDRSEIVGRAKARNERRPSAISGLGILVYLLASLALLALPIAAVVYKSLSADYASLVPVALRPLVYSAIIALVAALVSTFMAIRLSRGYSKLALLSFAAGSAVTGFAYSFLASRLPMVPGLVFAILAHISIAVPVAVAILLPFMRTIPDSLMETSRSLGYSSAYSFRKIDRKLVGKRVAAAFLISFMVSFGEFGTSLFLQGRTLPVLVFGTAASDPAAACAVATVMILVCSLLFIIAAVLLKSKEGEQSV